jgi:hypothetical protein
MNKDDYRYVRWEADSRNAAFWRNRLNQCPEGEAFDELRKLYREMAEEREQWALEYYVAMANDGEKP